MNSLDCIKVNAIRAYGYVGFLPEERAIGQWFEVNLTLWVNLQPAGASDNLQDTLDYRSAIAIVKNQIQTAKLALLEALTANIAEEILALDLVQQVRVELTKLAPPIADFSGSITIDILRTKLK